MGLLTDGGDSLPKICHTFPTMMKLGTAIPYLKEIQKIYHMTHPLSSADIRVIESLKIVLIKKVKILMSAKMATPAFLK